MWVSTDTDATVRVGLTDFAQDALGDVVAVTLPDVGDQVEPGEACGDVESTKSVNDLVAPVRGVVAETNRKLEDEPELINSNPYTDGWLFEIRLDDESGVDDLLPPTEYAQLTGG
jgi:glycine cleavage system H protein